MGLSVHSLRGKRQSAEASDCLFPLCTAIWNCLSSLDNTQAVSFGIRPQRLAPFCPPFSAVAAMLPAFSAAPTPILPNFSSPVQKRVVKIFLFVYNMARVWVPYPRPRRETERKEPKHGGYITDLDRHGHLHGRGHRSGHHLRETGQRQFRRLLPGRAQSAPTSTG